MESFLGWIGQIVEWFGLFIPRRIIVKATDELVKYKWDGSVEKNGSGLRWYWPIATEVAEITVIRQPLDIQPTFFTTKDNISCMVDCVVMFEITDSITFLTKNYDGFDAISESINAVLCKKLRAMTFTEIQESENIDQELTEYVSIDVESFGIEIEYIRLQNFTKTRTLSFVGGKRPTV